METTANHWTDPKGSNETGFTALPGGTRYSDSYYGIGVTCLFWSSDRISVVYGAGGFYYVMPYYPEFPSTPLESIRPVTNGLSIRCIKDS
jgi:uncharacterized protein (TIGR02145 family)